MNFQG